MALELIKETIKVNRVIAEQWTQAVFENDIIVPDVKPDIARILLLDGEAFINNAESLQDRVNVDGVILFKILYISDDEAQSIKSINTNVNFTQSLDITDARQGMKCKLNCEIEHIEQTLLNGRKINIKTIIKMGGKVTEEAEMDVANDLRGMDDIQVLKEGAKINYYLGSNKINYIIKESMEIPPSKPIIREILRSDVKISGKDYKITENKVIVKGDLNISTLYIGDDEERNIQFMEHEIPFTQFIDLEGTDENTICDVGYQVLDSRFEAEEDSDGELRFLNGEVSLNLSIEGYNKTKIDIIDDAYSTSVRLNIEKQPFRVDEVWVENKSQAIIKDVIVIGAESPEIAEVFNVLCKPSMTSCKLVDDKVVVEGVVNNNVLYLAGNSEQPVFCNKQEIPFKHTIDIKGIKPEMECDTNLDIEHCNYSMISATEVEIRVVIGVHIKVMDQVSIPLITKAVEAPEEDKKRAPQPSIIVYFSQQGDTLWNIGKRYLTTISDLQKMNDLVDRDNIVPGQQILIPRRI